MKHAVPFLVVFVVFCALAPCSSADDQPVRDTTIWWSPWLPGDSSPIDLFVNGILVGSDKDGMDAVLEIVRKLPRGTSVVWGPDLNKSWTINGKSTVPRRLPDLWEQFEKITSSNGLIVSSSFYRGYSGPRMPMVARVVAEEGARGSDDVLVRWTFVPPGSVDIFVQDKLVGRDAAGVLAVKALLESTPDNRIIRFLLGKRPAGHSSAKEYLASDALIKRGYGSTLAEVVQRRKLRAFIEKPRQTMNPSELASHHVSFSWQNYDYFTDSLHEDVIYVIDGTIFGIGNSGMNAVLKFLREQPDETVLSMPQFAPNSKFVPKVDKDRLPFPRRRDEFEELVKTKRIRIDYDRVTPQSKYQSDSFETLLSLGRVIRDRGQAQPADAVLSWTDFAPADRKADPDQARYLFNRADVGKGLQGFLAAMKEIDALPDGALLRIEPVCLSTKGPFACPIMIAGHPHLARTGREPFNTLILLLSEAVKRKSLRVELIPDERGDSAECISK